jgi:predicted RecA/RadA family phage recombinase
MKNFIEEGKIITLVAGGVVTGGTPEFIGGMAVIPASSGVLNDSIPCAVSGVFSLPKKASLAVANGDDLYWDSDPGEITKTAADGVYIGKAFEAALAADTTVNVKINAVRPHAQAAVVAAVATADSDATYGAAESTLINELKTNVNLILANLKAAGIMASA